MLQLRLQSKKLDRLLGLLKNASQHHTQAKSRKPL
jgi:hypothetical protein